MTDNKNKKSFFGGEFNLFSKLKLDANKAKLLIAIVLVIVVVLIFASSFKPQKGTKNIETKTSSSWEAYCEKQENRLEYVLGQMKGINNIKVFIMVDSSPTIKYLEETKTENVVKDQNQNSLIQTEIVLSKNGSISTPIVVVEMLPKITGVLVVAKGAHDVKTKTTLINTVSAILNVNVSSVEVLEGK